MLQLFYGEAMKKILLPLFTIGVILLIVININPISSYLASFLEDKKDVVILPSNEYTKNIDYLYVQRTDDYVPYSYQDLLNIIYSVLNNGWDSFTFYCPSEYLDCLKDFKAITDDKNILTHINNYVHPFNSFNNIKTSYDDSGEVNLEINKLYAKNDILTISLKVDNILAEVIASEMTTEDKILAIHDYVINHSKYDEARNDDEETSYTSNTAYGPLIQGYSVCGGYADAMAIFLYKLNINNFKVASEKHVWNAVNLDNQWLHLDLTWDDPLSSDGSDKLWHTYFLVTSNELINIDVGIEDVINHTFDNSIYLEFNEAT